VDERAFPWGDQFDQRSDHRLIPRNAGKTVAVGSYPAGASPYGLLDMVGNIQQWCADFYDEDYYKNAPAENPPGPVVSKRQRTTKSGLVQKLFNKNMPQTIHSAEHRVARGSSWKDYHESFAYTFRRDAFPPEVTMPWVGFRCVASFVPARPE
jgi:formylglycine-generating enzyme required for sulfatase activity